MESTTKTAEPQKPILWGVMGRYADADSLRAAAEEVRDAGYKKWDCYTPFPIHGLDRSMGIRPTILPWIVLGAGLTGCTVAIALQWYCNSPLTSTAGAGAFAGYPLIFSGKPYWSIPPNMPIAFELTVLFASLTSFFGLWTLIGLPKYWFPAFGSRRFRRVTDDGFFLIIEADDKNFDLTRTRELVRTTGCLDLEEIMD